MYDLIERMRKELVEFLKKIEESHLFTICVFENWQKLTYILSRNNCIGPLMSLLIRALIPTLMTSSKPKYLPKAPSPKIITWGLGLQHMNFRRMQLSP